MINGWIILAHPLFMMQFETLLAQVERLRQQYPDHYTKGKSGEAKLILTAELYTGRTLTIPVR